MYPLVSYAIGQLYEAFVTEPTFFPAHVFVDIHVISQLLVAAEHFLAVRTGSGFLRHLSFVRRFGMFDQHLIGGETPGADVTLELLSVGRLMVVPLGVRCGFEGAIFEFTNPFFRAFFTLGALTTVTTVLVFVTHPFGSRLRLVLRIIREVLGHVASKIRRYEVLFATFGADMGLLADVGSFVHLENRFVVEPLAAPFALEWLLTGVDPEMSLEQRLTTEYLAALFAFVFSFPDDFVLIYVNSEWGFPGEMLSTIIASVSVLVGVLFVNDAHMTNIGLSAQIPQRTVIAAIRKQMSLEMLVEADQRFQDLGHFVGTALVAGVRQKLDVFFHVALQCLGIVMDCITNVAGMRNQLRFGKIF